MGIVLSLSGTREPSAPELFLARAAEQIGAREEDPRPRVRIDEGAPILTAELHPAAEPLTLEARDDRRVELRAKTGTAGPGYHRAVCALALELGEALGIEWTIDEESDETGWLTAHDPARLEECFLDWLGGAAAQILELAGEGAGGFALSLPSGHVFEHDGAVATPLGPRDTAWLRAMGEDPRRGIDVFPWWGSERDGSYYLGLALSRMWIEVRWRAPLDDTERTLLGDVASWIERAFALDPALVIPWSEQSEILEYLGEESLRATRAQLKASTAARRAPIGYRRRPVRALLSGGWSMRIEGELAERWDERGTWVAWDEKRAVWFSSFTVANDAGEPSPSTEATLRTLPPLEGDEVLELERGELRGLAALISEERDGERVFRLDAHTAHGAGAAVGTLVFVSLTDREWALATWGSLAHES
jgi:hypothetical protein